MKTQNTLENKARFFAQYLNQQVFYQNRIGNIVSFYLSCGNFTKQVWIVSLEDENFKKNELSCNANINECQLILKPLSSITDEDLIQLTHIPEGWEIFKIYHTTRDGYSAVKIRKLYDDNDLKFNDDGYKYDTKTLSVKMANTVDYLRSKGYALPWMDLSIENLIEYGWIKLKEN